MPYANNKGADQPAHPCSLISAFVVHCLDSIPLVSISEIWSLYLVSVDEQAGLSLPWSQTPKMGFLATRLKYGCAGVPTWDPWIWNWTLQTVITGPGEEIWFDRCRIPRSWKMTNKILCNNCTIFIYITFKHDLHKHKRTSLNLEIQAHFKGHTFKNKYQFGYIRRLNIHAFGVL